MSVISLIIPMVLAALLVATAILGAGLVVAIVYLAARKEWSLFLNYCYVLVACTGVFLGAHYLQTREKSGKGERYKVNAEYLGYALSAPILLMFLPEPLRRARSRHRRRRRHSSRH